jgi:hypothetical protein
LPDDFSARCKSWGDELAAQEFCAADLERVLPGTDHPFGETRRDRSMIGREKLREVSEYSTGCPEPASVAAHQRRTK